jgi:hypothetical protein
VKTQRHDCAVLIVSVAAVSMGGCANAGGETRVSPPPLIAAQRITDVSGGDSLHDQDLAGQSVDAALQWLAAHQDIADGHWSSVGPEASGGSGSDVTRRATRAPTLDVAVTGLALLAFLGNGSTPLCQGSCRLD